ncbi:MAG: hypothetical protein PVG07_02285 [Acidobacteriota bacterium]|jgi:hypothetical protein
MRYRWLALFPLLYAAAFALLVLWLMDGAALLPFVRWQILLVRLLGLVGCFAAVSAFEPGDHLRRAWLLLGIATFALLLRDLSRFAEELTPAAEWAVAVLGVGGNLLFLAGIWMLASAWRKAVSSLSDRRGVVVAVLLVTAGLALAVAGPFAVEHFHTVAAGEWDALILLVSAIVDILALCMLGPLVLTTISLRGGLFAWPWGLVTASMFCWLLFDAAAGLGWLLGSGNFPATELFRGMAENYLLGAGLAQRFAVQHVRRAAG